MNTFKRIAFVFSLMFFTHGNAYAVVAIPCLASNNNQVCVTETANNSETLLGGAYQITNYGDERIYGFAVTNPDTAYAYSYESENSWSGLVLTKAEWNAKGAGIYFYDENEHGTILNMNSIGTFENLFGATENKVNLYWNRYYGFDETPLVNGRTLSKFYWSQGAPASNMIAFGLDGKIIASSIPQVPEPETYAMLLIGLGLIGFTARRKSL